MYRVMFCVARSIYAPVAYRYFNYKHWLWVYSQLNRLPHLQGDVIKCDRRSAA